MSPWQGGASVEICRKFRGSTRSETEEALLRVKERKKPLSLHLQSQSYGYRVSRCHRLVFVKPGFPKQPCLRGTESRNSWMMTFPNYVLKAGSKSPRGSRTAPTGQLQRLETYTSLYRRGQASPKRPVASTPVCSSLPCCSRKDPFFSVPQLPDPCIN